MQVALKPAQIKRGIFGVFTIRYVRGVNLADSSATERFVVENCIKRQNKCVFGAQRLLSVLVELCI